MECTIRFLFSQAAVLKLAEGLKLCLFDVHPLYNYAMSFLVNLFTPFGEILDRIICIVIVLLFMQFPMYINQYVDVLSGAQMESRLTYTDLESRALNNGLKVDEFIDRLKANEDLIVRESGEVSENVVNRYEKYTNALEALTHSSVWVRPFQLIGHYDSSINAAMQFEPGLPFNLEGFIYAAVGLIISLLIVGVGRWLFRRIFGSKKKGSKA